jgi:hypothetical protein
VAQLSTLARLRTMRDIAYAPLGILLYGSGLLVWPVCASLWRKKKRRTTALGWVFFIEIVCLLVLCGLAASGAVKLEHGYYWFIIWIPLNLLLTLVSLGAAAYDYARSETNAS